MADGRREATTEWIRDAARQEFTVVGARAFSLGGVAQRAHISKGAVYQRWPDKEACLTDLITNDLPICVEQIRGRWQDATVDLQTLVGADLTDEEHLTRLRFVAECVLAALIEPTFGDQAREALSDLERIFASRIPDSDQIPVIGWWTVCTLLANALLRTSGCPIPDSFVTHVTEIVMRIADCSRVVDQLVLVQGMVDSAPGFDPSHDFGDDTSLVLVKATQDLIESKGISEADARQIARAAGMTTGALYRRFGGKSEVLAAAFRAGLTTERYAWVDEFLLNMTKPDLPAAADTLATRMKVAWTDTETARTLIDFTIAAHTDPAILGAILGEMTRVAEHRSSLFAALIAGGVLREDLDPDALAWLIQIPTVGFRIVGSLGLVPSDEQLRELMSAYLVLLVSSPVSELAAGESGER